MLVPTKIVPRSKAGLVRREYDVDFMFLILAVAFCCLLLLIVDL